MNQFERLASERARTCSNNRISLQAILDRVGILEHIKTIDERLQDCYKKNLYFVNGRETIHQSMSKACEDERVHQRQAQQQRSMLLLKLDEEKKAEKELQQPLLDFVKTWRSVHAQQLQVPAFSDLEHKRKQVAEHLQSHQQGMHINLQYP